MTEIISSFFRNVSFDIDNQNGLCLVCNRKTHTQFKYYADGEWKHFFIHYDCLKELKEHLQKIK